MKRKTLTALTLTMTLFFGLSLAHAQDEAQTRGEQGEILTPLAIGNTWVYKEIEENLIVTDRIEGMVLFDARNWYLLRMSTQPADQPNAEPEPFYEYWLTHLDGVEADASLEIDEETESLKISYINAYFHYPATLGQSYNPDEEDDTWSVKVTALNEVVKTPAGEFTCVVYRETFDDDNTFIHTSYVAPGVGVVKYKTVDEEGTTTGVLQQVVLIEDE